MTTNEASSPGGSAAAAAPAGPAAHSPRSGVPPSALQLQGAAAQLAAKQVADGRRKVLSQLEDVVLDYFHNNPIHIEACLSTCIKLFGNVVHHPEEEKYRKVKAGSATFKGTVLAVKGGEDLLLHAGWVPRVIEMEKYWVFDAPADSWRFGLLKEALHLCDKSLHTVHDKAEKRRKEHEDKLTREEAEKERIRIAIEQDKAERRERVANAAAAAAGPVPAAVAAGLGAVGSPRPGSGTGPGAGAGSHGAAHGATGGHS